MEKAKAGEAICWKKDGDVCKDVVITPAGNFVCFMEGQENFWEPKHFDKFAMAPLAWVEGKPVYKGDVLYHQNTGTCTANKFDESLGYLLCDFARWYGHPPCGGPADQFTWTPLKKTREVKLLGWISDSGELRILEGGAVPLSNWLRVPSEDRTMTVEE